MCYKDGHCRSIENNGKWKQPSQSERTFLKNLIKLWKKQSTDQDLSSKRALGKRALLESFIKSTVTGHSFQI